MKELRTTAWLASAMMWLGFASPARAAVIFDNSVNDLNNRFHPGTMQVGDEIMLGSTERYLTNFSFEFFAVNADHPGFLAGTDQARVQFYLNDGPLFNGYHAPGTSLYDSGWFDITSPTERSTFNFANGADFPLAGLDLTMVASNMSWTVQFRGMSGADDVGIDLFSAAVVGSDTPDYWEYTGGSWSLMTNSVPMDFAARMEASPAAVPEPSSLMLSLLGGIGIVCVLRRVRGNA